jgi:hypothetical protein
MDTEERQDFWYQNGIRYGFPVCCVLHFLQMKLPHEKGPWTGTGYIPCPQCAPHARADFRKFVAEHITPNRKFHKPFPHDEHNEGLHPEWPE